MPPLTKNAQSCGCKRQKKERQQRRLSLLLAFFVAILPKCPFCAFGYSSVVVMCSGARVHTYEANQLGYISIFLALAVLISLFWNYKGKKTWLAVVVATLGSSVLAHAQIFTGNVNEYFLGTSLILLAVLLNGRWYNLLQPRIRNHTS